MSFDGRLKLINPELKDAGCLPEKTRNPSGRFSPSLIETAPDAVVVVIPTSRTDKHHFIANASLMVTHPTPLLIDSILNFKNQSTVCSKINHPGKCTEVTLCEVLHDNAVNDRLLYQNATMFKIAQHGFQHPVGLPVWNLKMTLNHCGNVAIAKTVRRNSRK